MHSFMLITRIMHVANKFPSKRNRIDRVPPEMKVTVETYNPSSHRNAFEDDMYSLFPRYGYHRAPKSKSLKGGNSSRLLQQVLSVLQYNMNLSRKEKLSRVTGKIIDENGY